MENSGAPLQQTEQTKETLSGFGKLRAAVKKGNSAINLTGMLIFHLRKIVLAAPVVYYALKLAAYNQEHLPEQVGINLLATGEFAQTISRGIAVMGPLALTLGCLVLMFFSRKAMYSWAISVFTLALPLLLLFSNLYPA